MLLSNSDPKNTNSDDDFFDNLYNDYVISRIDAIIAGIEYGRSNPI